MLCVTQSHISGHEAVPADLCLQPHAAPAHVLCCRRIAVRRFRCDASVRVALLSVTAAGVGLDFSAASVVVFAGQLLPAGRLVAEG